MLPMPCEEWPETEPELPPKFFIGIDMFRTLSRIIWRMVFRKALRKSAVLLDST